MTLGAGAARDDRGRAARRGPRDAPDLRHLRGTHAPARSHDRAGGETGPAGSPYRATLKLTVQLPSAPTRRSHIGSIISGPRDEVMSPRSMTPRQPNHSLRIFV